MCGIVGALSFEQSNFEITSDYIEKMRDVMTHRGPDGCDLWISPDKKVGLGHRRLSIIDLSTSASQPMSNNDQSVWITFNGEIYNHNEIRQEIKQHYHGSWKTDHSDTEVILRAYELWGYDCLHRLRGMFSFAIWDGKKRKLWLVRDRIGVKPLYYSFHNGRFTFASEIKALLEDRDQPREVDLVAMYHYLSFSFSPSPQTLYSGIEKLPGGHYLILDEKGNKQQVQYWDVWDHVQDLQGVDEEEITQRILQELRESVELRKVSDVPVGVFLSGGVDSSTNAALFSHHGKETIKTFSVGYDQNYQSYQNELHHAQRMAQEINSQHFESRLTQDDLFSFFPQMIHLQDEPIADPVCIPVYYVSKLARDNGIIVCQVGEGADELFWGYRRWQVYTKIDRANQLPCPKFIKKMGLGALSLLGQNQTDYYELLRRACDDKPIFWGGVEGFTVSQKNYLLDKEIKKQLGGLSSWDVLSPHYERFHSKAPETSFVNWMSYLDLKLRLPELLLMRVDKMSMGVSLESRVPFLDHKFVELAMSIPTSLKTKNGISKYPLKKAVRGVIPDDIIDRKKQGFGVPTYEWYFDRFGQEIRQEIREFSQETKFFRPKALEKTFQRRGANHFGYILWNLARWWREFVR